MRTIKFHTTEYQLVDHENVLASSFQATLLKESYTIESIIEDITNTEEIKIYENEEIVAIYTGYTIMRAISIYMNENDIVISVELDNYDVYSQLNNITEALSTIEEIQNVHTDDITELNAEVIKLIPYTETKIGCYGETEKIFYGVPEGNVSVFFDNYHGAYTTSRQEDRLYVYFDALEKETNITISIM